MNHGSLFVQHQQPFQYMLYGSLHNSTDLLLSHPLYYLHCQRVVPRWGVGFIILDWYRSFRRRWGQKQGWGDDKGTPIIRALHTASLLSLLSWSFLLPEIQIGGFSHMILPEEEKSSGGMQKMFRSDWKDPNRPQKLSKF